MRFMIRRAQTVSITLALVAGLGGPANAAEPVRTSDRGTHSSAPAFLDGIRIEVARIANLYDSPLDRRWYLQDDAQPLDHWLKKSVQELFRRHKTIDLVIKHTRQDIEWREFPENLDLEKRTKLQFAPSEKIVISYRSRRIEGRGVLLVLENSFWLTERLRLAPSFYALWVRKEGVELLPFQERHWPPGYVPFEYQPVFLGFVERGSTLPGVLLLHGPSGTGHFAYLTLHQFRDGPRFWEHHYLGEKYSPLGEFRYDERTLELTNGSKGTKAIFVVKQLLQYLPEIDKP